MADYYTKLSFAFTATPEEAARFQQLNQDLTTELTEQELAEFDLDAEFYPGPDFSTDYHNGAIHVWSEESPNLELLAFLVQRACPSSLPVSFQYSWDCSKPRTDAFGGGACVITADDIRFKTTNDLVEEMLADG